jgi:hypothetical protein
MFLRKFLLLPLIAVTSIALTSCSDDDNNNIAAPQTTTAKVKVVHTSPDAPKVDILLDNAFVDTLSFPRNTTYLDVPAGERNVKVRATGTSIVPIDANVTFDANKIYSVFAIDVLSNISALVTTDDLIAPASGKAHVRFIHLSPDAPAVNIIANGSVTLFSNRSFNKSITAAEQAFTPVDAGTYDIQVRTVNGNALALDLPGITLTAGKIYTVFAKGLLSGTGSQALGAQIIVNN